MYSDTQILSKCNNKRVISHAIIEFSEMRHYLTYRFFFFDGVII